MAKHISLDGGKYTLYVFNDGEIVAERYRNPWPAGTNQFVGNKMLHALVEEFIDRDEEAVRLEDALADSAREVVRLNAELERMRGERGLA